MSAIVSNEKEKMISTVSDLKLLFPHTHNHILEKALEECDNDLDAAIKRLHELSLGFATESTSAEGTNGSAEKGMVSQTKDAATAIEAFKLNPDTGRSMFEELLKDHPRNVELWISYLDQEIKIGDKDLIRSLFDRATLSARELLLPFKDTVSILLDYISYERSVSDEDRIKYALEQFYDYMARGLYEGWQDDISPSSPKEYRTRSRSANMKKTVIP